MPGYTLVPVDYQPDFGDYSLVPVDYDPFAADDVIQQWRIQQAQAQPQQQPPAGAGQPDAAAPSAGGVLSPLRDENDRIDSYVYKRLFTGTPPTGPQVTTANGSHTFTATDGANRTKFGGVYGHTLTLTEPGSNDLGTLTAADPTGLLVATPVEGDPNFLSVR